jgi:hypothetical protein
MTTNQPNSSRDGAVLGMVLILVMVLGILAVTLLSLSQDIGIEVSHDVSDAQAFWAAEAGIEQAKVIGQLKRKPYKAIPTTNGVGTLWGSNVLAGVTSQGRYSVNILDDPSWSNAVHTLQKYIITSVGTSAGGRTIVVSIHAALLNYSGYLNASHLENGVYYGTGDLLDGPVDTDDQLNILGPPGPIFMSLVSTATNYVNYTLSGSLLTWTPTTNEYNAVWEGGLALNAPKLDIQGQFGDHVTDIQIESQLGGLELDGSAKGDYSFNFKPDGSFNYSNMVTHVLKTNNLASLNGTIYVDGNAYVQGVVNGNVTLAARQSINIVSDIVYASASGLFPTPWTTNFNNATVDDMLGLMAGNTMHVQGSNSINIHASILIATNGFNADHSGDVLGGPKINLFGAMSQYSRGVVGHPTTQFEGFHKNYKFDQRYVSDAPPFFPPSVYSFTLWQ